MLVLGSACPAAICPASADVGLDPVALALIAPSARQLAERDWLAAAIKRATAQLDEQGLLYVLAPPSARWRAWRLLRAQGFAVEAIVAHLPNREVSRLLVPVSSARLRAATQLLPLRRRSQRLLRLLAAFPGGTRLLALTLPAAGMLARRPRHTPPPHWLAADVTAFAPAEVILETRPHLNRAIVHLFEPGAVRASAVVKVGLTAADDSLGREADALRHLAPPAAQARVRVPELIAARQQGWPFLAQSVLPGRSAAVVLAHEPGQLPGLLSALTAWLRSWHARTRHDAELTDSQLDAWVLEPATRLLGSDAPDYLAWLRQHCQAVAGRRVSLVATHHDLTMANVLVADDGLGIVDWESATASGTPLADFCYAAADAVAARTGYRARLTAFTACFARDGELAREVEQLGRQLVPAPGAADDPLDLWFHACWLQHAANEQRRGLDGPQPFRDIIAWLASHHAQLAPWLTATRAAP
jgi:hypothetical protein